LLWNK